MRVEVKCPECGATLLTFEATDVAGAIGRHAADGLELEHLDCGAYVRLVKLPEKDGHARLTRVAKPEPRERPGPDARPTPDLVE